MSAEISAELRAVLRRLKLSPMLATLPERITLARSRKLPYEEFLEIVLSDEIARRDRLAGEVRARAARLDPGMRQEAWDETSAVSFDRELWAELATLRFCEEAHNVLVMDRWGWARPTWPRPSATSRAGGDAPLPSTAPTDCSSTSRRPAWGPPTKRRCAS
jgi:hypothetical protein